MKIANNKECLGIFLVVEGVEFLNVQVKEAKTSKYPDYPSLKCFDIEESLKFLISANEIMSSNSEKSRFEIYRQKEIMKRIINAEKNSENIKELIKTGVVSPLILKDEELIILCLKSISDESFSSDFMFNGAVFSFLKNLEKIETFKIMSERFKKDPELASEIASIGEALATLRVSILEFSEISGEAKKFITAYNNSNFYIAIGDGDHSNILGRLENETKLSFREELVGGGLVKVAKNDSNITSIVFYDVSGTFGEYNKKVLLKFKKTLQDYFKNRLGAVEVDIKESERV